MLEPKKLLNSLYMLKRKTLVIMNKFKEMLRNKLW